MTTTKVLAAIGLISIIAFAGVCLMLMSTGGEHNDGPSSSYDIDASTDGLTKDEIQAKLQGYADLLNSRDGKNRYLMVNGEMLKPTPGSVKVVNGDLILSVTEASSYYTGTTYYYYEYVVPYHSIAGLKTIKDVQKP